MVNLHELREISEYPHDVAGAQELIRAAADEIAHLRRLCAAMDAQFRKTDYELAFLLRAMWWAVTGAGGTVRVPATELQRTSNPDFRLERVREVDTDTIVFHARVVPKEAADA